MPSSMTGFAIAEIEEHDFGLVWEIRSVNHRFLDVSFRLAEEFRQLEPDFRMIVKNALGRGKIDCNLRFKATAEFVTTKILEEKALENIRKIEKGVLKHFPEAPPLSIGEILRWPGVLEGSQHEFPKKAYEAAKKCLGIALVELSTSREREGERISALMKERTSLIRGILLEIRSKLGAAEACYRRKLLERLEKVDITPNPERLEQELVLLAQRLDVTEELDRLEGHVAETEDVLNCSEPMGRRMDFFIQELNREANTLASKSQDEDIGRLAVELKVLIEQMREQAQNLE